MQLQLCGGVKINIIVKIKPQLIAFRYRRKYASDSLALFLLKVKKVKVGFFYSATYSGMLFMTPLLSTLSPQSVTYITRLFSSFLPRDAYKQHICIALYVLSLRVRLSLAGIVSAERIDLIIGTHATLGLSYTEL